MSAQNILDWGWQVYSEMFLAGVAAGAFVIGCLLQLRGRGNAGAVRSAHLLAFPLMVLAGILLTIDLNRPERFWHMVWMSQRPLPMFKWWSPMSVGSWALLLFSIVTFLSFLDALIARGAFSLGSWRKGHGLYDGRFARTWTILGIILGLVIGGYSGVLLNVSNVAGWSDSPLVGALFVTTAAVTGLAALLLAEALRGGFDEPESRALRALMTPLILWQVLLAVLQYLTIGPGRSLMLSGLPMGALVAAVLLGAIIPLALLNARPLAGSPGTLVLVTLSTLVGDFMLRYSVVVGPQHG